MGTNLVHTARPQGHPDEFASLRREVAALRREVTHLRGRRRTRAGRARFVAALGLALLVALVPLSLLAANPFTDLNPGSPHNANIDAIYNAGVTTGCVPNAQYCPNDNVTREQMASFLARLGGLGANPPVANAKTLQGYAPNGLARVAQAQGGNNVFADPPQTPTNITSATPQAIATVTIVVPADGFVLVTGSTGGLAAENRALTVRLRDAANGTFSPPVGLSGVEDGAAGTISAVYVFPATAGARAYVLEANADGPTTPGEVMVVNTNLVALFVPFGSTGGNTLALP